MGSKTPHAEFAYNKAPTKAIRCSPFEALYGINPLALVDFIPYLIDYKVSCELEERAKEIKGLHKRVRAHIEKRGLQGKG